MREEVRQPSATADIAAAMRAAESLQPAARRIFHDEYAYRLLGRSRLRLVCKPAWLGRLAISVMDRRMPGILSEALLRGRYLDVQLVEAAAHGIRQVVLLGAGYDSTALRHELPAGSIIYEVDHPLTQAEKINRLRIADLRNSTQVSYVPCDFAQDSLAAALSSAGFRASEPALFAWMAVTMYLDADSAKTALEDIRKLCAPNSRVVLDYMYRDVIDGTSPHLGALRAARYVAARGEPYTFGLQPAEVDPWLTAAGFTVVDHVSAPDLLRRFGLARNPSHPVADFMGLITTEPK
jgi:methyltransferase (TIGR00027 family)